MSPLILAFTYTACQDDRLGKASLFIITVPATWVPAAMLFMTFVQGGLQPTMVHATGLVAAHLHYFLSELWPTFGGGTNIIKTPAFIERFFEVSVSQVLHRTYGTAIRNPGPASQRPTTGASTGASAGGVLPESWRSRGSGHRLGGD